MLPLEFDNQFTAQLPADPVEENTPRQVSNAIYSRVLPAQVRAPALLACAVETAELLGLSEQDCASPTFLQAMSGNALLQGSDPHATCYGGHQFGNWAGQLGDGRAINLGEVSAPGHHDTHHYMLQLKGAGPTPYSRTADGLAVLRSSIREFLCSEAMHHLGIPTTRALSLVTTGEEVVRDMLYDGNPRAEPGAVVCRVSSSFVRFGHFQMLAARGEEALLRSFTDFVIRREYGHLCTDGGIDRDVIINWFNEVCGRTAEMVVHWMRVGFVHGVMNTDNMSILGETIDYGPYGWLDDFDPDWTPNTTDANHRRYRYCQQPAIAQWNLMQLANAILPLVGEPKPLEEALSAFARNYESSWQAMMAAKLGLNTYDKALTDTLLTLLTAVETDMTLFYRRLAELDPVAGSEADYTILQTSYYQHDQLTDAYKHRLQQWLRDYRDCLRDQRVAPAIRHSRMNSTNPKFVLRNYLAQQAIDEAEAGRYEKISTLLDVMRRPYDEQPHYEGFADKRPDWARTRVGCSMLSCSS